MDKSDFSHENITFPNNKSILIPRHNNRLAAVFDTTDFITLAVITTLSSIFNGVSIYLISRKKRLRAVDYLIINLSFVTFLMSITYLGMYSMGQLPYPSKTRIGAWVCGLANFAKYFPGFLITLTSFGISYERIRSLKQRQPLLQGSKACFSMIKVILFIWALSTLWTFPAAFSSTSSTNTFSNYANDSLLASRTAADLCHKIPVLSSKFLDVFYEIFKFFCIGFLFPTYLLYELFLIRSKIKYLCSYSVPGPRLQKKVCRVRFAFLYSLILVTIWMSQGVVQLLYKIPAWFGGIDAATVTNSQNIIKGFTFIFLLLNPVAVFLANQDFKIFKLLLGKKPEFSSGTKSYQETLGTTEKGTIENDNRIESGREDDDTNAIVVNDGESEEKVIERCNNGHKGVPIIFIEED